MPCSKVLLSVSGLSKFYYFFSVIIPTHLLTPTLPKALANFIIIIIFNGCSKFGCVSGQSGCFGSKFWTVPRDSNSPGRSFLGEVLSLERSKRVFPLFSLRGEEAVTGLALSQFPFPLSFERAGK